MKIETNKFNTKTITPNDGKLLVSHNARVISDEVLLGIDANADEWEEISTEEAEALQKQWESELLEEATETDYQRALAEMGVDLNG